MVETKKLLLPVALIAALVGGTVGAFVRPGKTVDAADKTTATTLDTSKQAVDRNAQDGTAELNTQVADNTQNRLTDEQEAFRDGFNEGFLAGAQTSARNTQYASTAAPRQVVYRPARRARTVYYNQSRRAYYDYEQPRRGRSFWQKHRDKLTVAMGTGGGGSALYTYKLRNRSRRY